MCTLRRSLAAAVPLVAAFAGTPARADLPPPDGMVRVDYRFRVDAVPADTTLVAYPINYPNNDGDSVSALVAGRDAHPVQGYRPGIYALATADAAGIPRGERQAIAAYLQAKARLCLKLVPRVFQVAEATGITKLTNVIHVDAAPERCSARLVTTIYEGPRGQRGEGGVDAEGNRRPPAPFGKDVPDVNDAGFGVAGLAPAVSAVSPTPVSEAPETATPASPTPPPATSEAPRTAGCSVAPTATTPWLLIMPFMPFMLLARRRR